MWWAARREFAIKSSILEGNGTEAPDAAHMNIRGEFSSSSATLDIETATVPDAMIVAMFTVLRLSLWTVGCHPLCRQILLSDRQRSAQPQHGAAAGQHPRNLLSHVLQHG